MFSWMYKVFTDLHPPHADHDHYGWRVAVFFWIVILIVIVFGGLALNLGALSRFGITGVAWASEVDKKVNSAVEKLEERIDTTDEKVDDAVTTSKAILRALYLPQIRAKVRQRCDADSFAKREEINKEIDRIRAEYRNLSGETFGPNPSCNEV